MRKLFLMLPLVAMFALGGCSADKGVRGVKHVVMIGLDGLAGNTVEAAEMPTLKQMMAEGAWTLQARSILPSSSACNWASMYMGVGPEMHGYNTWGSRKPDFPSIELCENGIMPTIFTVLRRHNPEFNLSAHYEWVVHGDLIDNKSVDCYQHVPMVEPRGDALVAAYTDYLKANKPEYSICIFDSPDVEGHAHGWGSEIYKNRLKSLDAQLAQIIDATKQAGMYDNTIFMVVSDHGGIGQGHGRTSMDEMEGVLVFCGKGIKRGHKIQSSVVRYDTAPTIARIFGAEVPAVWRGRAIEEIFE
ncbi:MAG: alkaline phosphatase [Rikenellaceae bacterium]|nr:alkaline phosphatase [Rikenellaceae bacterium]